MESNVQKIKHTQEGDPTPRRTAPRLPHNTSPRIKRLINHAPSNINQDQTPLSNHVKTLQCPGAGIFLLHRNISLAGVNPECLSEPEQTIYNPLQF